MEQKHDRKAVNRYTVGISALLVIAIAAVTLLMLKHSFVQAEPSTKQPVGAAVPSQFSFGGADGWWQGATNRTSMAVFHRTDGCFVSAEYKLGAVNAVAEVQKTNATLSSQGYTVLPVGTQTLMLQTSDGPQKYSLEQSSVTSPSGSSKVMGGQEFGYLQLTDGYLKIMGYCDTAAQLPATIAPLQAINFDPSK